MGDLYATFVCRLCGGRIEDHRVYLDRPVRGKVVRTTCAAVGAEMDKRIVALVAGAEPWATRMERECQTRRDQQRHALAEPIRSYLS